MSMAVVRSHIQSQVTLFSKDKFTGGEWAGLALCIYCSIHREEGGGEMKNFAAIFTVGH